mmetsp:Transcript_716/g.1150  ORF Transcript_716/g.1150 Transcript_716/m.1150 type:complete len:640 (-) Transcript_716:419-2338(-)
MQGLPPKVSDLIQQINIETLYEIKEHITLGLTQTAEYLQLPPWEEYRESLLEAAHVTYKAVLVDAQLIYVTLRPLFILLSWFMGHFARLMSFLLKDAAIRSQISVKRVIVFQHSLPRFWILVEASIIAACIAAYLLRRLIKRRRYVERLRAWYDTKRRAAQRKYDAALDKVSRISTTLAMCLPHILYGVGAFVVKWLLSDVFVYIASDVPLLECITVFEPTFHTVVAVQRFQHLCNVHRKLYANDPLVVEDDSPPCEDNERRGVDNYEPMMTKIQLKKEEKKSNAHLQKLLRYWVIFGLVISFGKLLIMLPLVCRLVLKIEDNVIRQLLLVMFVWLRYLPLPSSKQMGKTFGKHARLYSTNTIDIVYCNLVQPFLLPLANVTEGRKQTRGMIELFLAQLETFLSVCVFMKALRAERKEQIVHVVTEGLALLPACTTLLMPSMFTAYGCVYVGGFVSTANSAKCDDAIVKSDKKAAFISDDDPKLLQLRMLRVRWLRYWCVYVNVLFLLARAGSILAWIPLSTHATLVLLVWLQLPAFGGAPLLYDILVTEMSGFGIIEPDESFDAEKTLMMRVLNHMSTPGFEEENNDDVGHEVEIEDAESLHSSRSNKNGIPIEERAVMESSEERKTPTTLESAAITN